MGGVYEVPKTSYMLTWGALGDESIVAAEVQDEGTRRERPRAVNTPGSWQPWHRSWSAWDPYRAPTLRILPRGWQGGTIHIYTDGSTGALKKEPSGYSAVLTMGSTVIATARGACRASGNNFLAEAVGILYALHLCPSTAPLYIGSDSKAAIGATNKHRIRDWLASVRGEYQRVRHSTEGAGSQRGSAGHEHDP